MGFLSDDERAQLLPAEDCTTPLPYPNPNRLQRRVFP